VATFDRRCVCNRTVWYCRNLILTNCVGYDRLLFHERHVCVCVYSYAPCNDVSVNNGPHIRRWSHNTGRFIMLSVITNIYNNNYSQPQENWKSFFLTTRDVRCVHHGWHDTHRYDIQVLATHESTWSLHTLTSPSGRKICTTMKNNLLGKKFFELFLPSVQVS
jgi:hypothetical protein